MKNIKKFIMNKDIRDIFFDNIRSKFIKNNNIFILTNDADVFSLKKSRKHKRFIDVGVSEQNLINVASGLSKSKKISIIYGFCTFLTFNLNDSISSHLKSTSIWLSRSAQNPSLLIFITIFELNILFQDILIPTAHPIRHK